MVEDDLLAEIYLERENEYTLAGSIYKGRVTRVLPGMQSAFVDIGLERDAFLYVSDFMELEEGEDVDEISTARGASEPRPAQTVNEVPPSAERIGRSEAASAEPGESVSPPLEHREHSSGNSAGSPAGDEEEGGERGAYRGRRRRRGRRGERMPESKFANAAPAPQRSDRSERSNRPERTERSDYGPPPGYQPMLLPGESISKYQRLAQSSSGAPRVAETARAAAVVTRDATPAISESFPGDEPLFAVQAPAASAVEHAVHLSQSRAEAAVEEIPSTASERERDKEDERLDASDVEQARASSAGSETLDQGARLEPPSATLGAAGTLEEEEIEEEEADLAHYVEELEEDAAFEEMEEETHAAADYQSPDQPERLPSLGSVVEPTYLEKLEAPEALLDPAAEAEEAGEEAEIEEAQAEAEALLDAESENGAQGEARVEVRAPAGTVPYTQRAPRPSPDRRPQRGGRRNGAAKGFRGRRNEQHNVPLISDLLKEGQEVLVQIAKEPIGKKGARITSHIALPGRFLVYMPTVNHTGVSRKIASEEERQRLKRIIGSERENGSGGFIVRTAAQGADEEELRADIRFLKGLWNEIKARAESGKAPALIYHDLNVVERVLRDQVTSDFSAIWVDTEAEYERIVRFANRFQPALVRRVKLYTKEIPLFEQFGLSEEINKALKSKVWLKSGGYIVINQTEALVAIDINTGKYVGKTARLEDTIVKTNVDAIKEIVRQIRLRDLGGIIVIDFIDMDERRNRQKVMQALEEALRSDRAPSKVLQFNDFGLVAITRKRVKQSLERTIGSPCPYCDSTGFVKSVTTVSNDIYIEMRKMAKNLDHADVMLRVNPEVAKALKANGGKALSEMEELTKKTIIVKSDPALHQEQFDIN
jgi:ribonuclease G